MQRRRCRTLHPERTASLRGRPIATWAGRADPNLSTGAYCRKADENYRQPNLERLFHGRAASFWTSGREPRLASKSEKWDQGQEFCTRRSLRSAHPEVAAFYLVPHVFTNGEQSTLFLRTVWRTEPHGPPQNNSCLGDAAFSVYSLVMRAQDERQPASHFLGGDCFAKGGTRRRTLDTLGNFHQTVII